MKKITFLAFLFVPILLASCANQVEVTHEEKLTPKFSKVANNPTDYEQAARERHQLCKDIDAILASLTGDQFQLTNDKFLNHLRADYSNLRRGMNRLYAERSEHGLTFQQDMDAFLPAIKNMLITLQMIHKKLEYLPPLPENDEPQTQPDAK